MNDYGAHNGYIISKAGFQKGAYEASKNTNINLLTWEEFLQLFRQTWQERMFWRISHASNQINYYCGGYVYDLSENIELTENLATFETEEYITYLAKVKNIYINTPQLSYFLTSVINNSIKFPLQKRVLESVMIYENESHLYDEIINKQIEILDGFDRIFGIKLRMFKET